MWGSRSGCDLDAGTPEVDWIRHSRCLDRRGMRWGPSEISGVCTGDASYRIRGVCAEAALNPSLSCTPEMSLMDVHGFQGAPKAYEFPQCKAIANPTGAFPPLSNAESHHLLSSSCAFIGGRFSPHASGRRLAQGLAGR